MRGLSPCSPMRRICLRGSRDRHCRTDVELIGQGTTPTCRAMLPALAHIDAWIFDLDNTLYPASADLFGLIDKRMTAYVMRITGLSFDEAYKVQKGYFREHGTTLNGLMREHGVDPHEFLADVHAIE